MAAEEALQKVEADLNCSVCLEVYTDPKLLQCHHVFCKECLEGLVTRNHEVFCPTCRKVSSISAEEGVASLQPAFHINNLLDILNKHKKATKELKKVTEEPKKDSEVHTKATKHKSPTKEDNGPAEDVRYCPDHSSRILESFCETCDKLVCLECAFEHHQGHKCTLVSRLFEKSREDILSSLNLVESHLELLRKSVDAMHVWKLEISKQQDSLLAEVCEHTRQIQEAAEARKVELVDRIHWITEDKLHELASQKDATEETIAKLSNYLDDIHKNLETSSHEEVMKMKAHVIEHAKILTESYQPDSLEPIANVDTVFSAKLELTKECRSFGDVYTSGSPDSSQCLASGEGLESATVDEKHTVILQATASTSESQQKLKPSVECEIVSELTSERVKCVIEAKRRSHLKITYNPTTKGRHRFHIKVKGQHIKGSPFIVDVKLPVERLGRPILTFVAENPRGIAIGKEGELMITEVSKQSCISNFSVHGKRIRSFNNLGFVSPSKLAVDVRGNVLVVDREACCIWVFTPEGQKLKKIGDITEGKKAFMVGTGGLVGAGIGVQIAGPIGILVGGAIGVGVDAIRQAKDKKLTCISPHSIAINFRSRRLYVLEDSQVQVLYLHSSTFIFAFGECGSGKGQFNSPSGIVCDSTGKVYVADTGNHRIQVFTAEGKFVKMFGNEGEDKERIHEPHGIAVDSDGIVYVSQPYEHRISVFTAAGHFVTSFSTRLEDEEPNKYGPMELAVDSQGILYVCDPLACKIKLF